MSEGIILTFCNPLLAQVLPAIRFQHLYWKCNMYFAVKSQKTTFFFFNGMSSQEF